MSQWQSRAKCKGQTDLFYSEAKTDIYKAIEICMYCPVRVECLKAEPHEIDKLSPYHIAGVRGGIPESIRNKKHIERLEIICKRCNKSIDRTKIPVRKGLCMSCYKTTIGKLIYGTGSV